MRKYLALLMILCCIFPDAMHAQELTVKSMQTTNDLSASQYRRADRNNEPCGLVKVSLATAGATFEGNVIQPVEYKTGEYWVYMTKGSRELRIKHPSFVPLHVKFADYGIKDIQPLTTYSLTLLMPQIGQAVDDGMRYLAMTVEPMNATVYVDNSLQPLQNGTLSILLSMGQHQYRVEAPGYEPKSGIFTIGDETLQLPVKLESAMASLSVSTTTQGTQIYVNDQLRGTSSWNGTLPPGSYRIEGRLQGYRNHRQNITLAQHDFQQLTIPALQAITGVLNVNYQPLNTEVWIDGKKAGTSPSVFRNIIVGSHTVELRAAGYTSKQERVNIEEGKTAMLTGALESQQLTSARKKELNKKVKEFQKEGWKVKADSPSLADQFARCFQVQMDTDDEGYEKWFTAEGKAVGTIYDAAREQALSIAQGEISSKLRVDLTSRFEEYLANEHFAQSDCELIAKTVVTQMSESIDQKVNRPRTLMDSYRELPNGNIEVLIIAAISSEAIKSLVDEGKNAMLSGVLERQQSTTVAASSSPSSASSSGAAIETITVNGVSFNMVRVDGGTFTMGATKEQGKLVQNNAEPAHQVKLSCYSIGESEVTQALWQAVMGSNPSNFKGDQKPVEQVSWNDCQAFISKLNQLTGRRFRLPTEAEWEYAARGGKKSRGYMHSGSNNFDDVGWYTKTTNDTGTRDVKTKQANELGLYDMSGNVWEWCQDWSERYSSGSQTNPTGPLSGNNRVIRGGSWSSSFSFSGQYGKNYWPVAYRRNHTPHLHYNDLGLRLAL